SIRKRDEIGNVGAMGSHYRNASPWLSVALYRQDPSRKTYGDARSSLASGKRRLDLELGASFQNGNGQPVRRSSKAAQNTNSYRVRAGNMYSACRQLQPIV